MIKQSKTKMPNYLLLLISLYNLFPTDFLTIIFHFLLLTSRKSFKVDDWNCMQANFNIL